MTDAEKLSFIKDLLDATHNRLPEYHETFDSARLRLDILEDAIGTIDQLVNEF